MLLSPVRPEKDVRRKQFDPAKQKEIKNYVVNDVLGQLEQHEKPPRESTLRMRWVLEYRLDENENKSPEARIVILGYLDLDYENGPAASPTMTSCCCFSDHLQPMETSVEYSCKVASFNEISGYCQYQTTVLEKHGWRRLKSDPCCWMLIDPALVKNDNTQGVMTRSECPMIAATGGHVDDFCLRRRGRQTRSGKQRENNY